MINNLQKLKEEAFSALKQIKDEKSFRDFEIEYLGRKGKLAEAMKGIIGLDGEEKKEAGRLANEIKQELISAFNEARGKISSNKNESFFDVTLPGEYIKAGHLHPITIIRSQLEDLFTSMGFIIEEGPELESDYYNFEAVNIPKFHPARDMQDTFYVDKKNEKGEYDLMMRTHTSSVQVRAMQKHGAPLRCIVPGRCFRNEATDVRHEHTFYQIEGLMIGEDVSIANLKAVLLEVGKNLYGPETKLRLRPKFYPFVEPGLNGEFSCFVCNGKGCRLCKNTGWLEIVGAGMIHPNVLKAGGIDPKKYSGFAFGFGLNRLAMLKYMIDDIRLFNGGDIRFLEQF